MKKFIATFALATLFAMPLSAKTITVDVNGLVCDFCAQAIQITFGKKDGVTDVNVDLTTKQVVIDLDENAELTDEEITRLITDSGYDLVAINRSADTDNEVE
jgi:cation transport ATPase